AVALDEEVRLPHDDAVAERDVEYRLEIRAAVLQLRSDLNVVVPPRLETVANLLFARLGQAAKLRLGQLAREVLRELQVVPRDARELALDAVDLDADRRPDRRGAPGEGDREQAVKGAGHGPIVAQRRPGGS